MKKCIIVLTFCFVLFVSCFPVYALGQAPISQEKIGPTANSSQEMLDGSILTKANENGLEFKKEAITNKKVVGGKYVEEHVKNIVNIIPENEAVKDNLLDQAKDYSLMSSNYNYRFTWDTTQTVEVYTTVYFTVTESDMEYISLDYVTGGYYCNNLNGSTIVGNVVSYGQSGWYYGGYRTQSNTQPWGVATNFWTVYPGITWTPVAWNNTQTVGATYVVTLQRPNGYKWDVTLSNNI